MKTYKQKILAMTLGVLASLLLLELGLRVLGFAYWDSKAPPEAEKSGSAGWKPADCPECQLVLCIGDSFTYGMGASEGNDYPSHLERLLNAPYEVPRFRVINGGIGGANSTTVLDTLRSYLDVFDPAVVTVMMGGADFWDYYGYAAYAHRHSISGRLFELMHNIRILRLANHLRYEVIPGKRREAASASRPGGTLSALDHYVNWWSSRPRETRAQNTLSPEFEKASQALRLGELESAISFFSAGVAMNPTDSSNYWGLGFAYRTLRRYDESSQWYKRGIAADPSDPNNYFGIGQIHFDLMIFGEVRESWFRKGIKADPTFSPNYCALADSLLVGGTPESKLKAIDLLKKGLDLDASNLLCYSPLCALRSSPNDEEKMREILEGLEANSEVARGYLAMFNARDQKRESAAWLEDDLEKVLELSRSRGAEVVFQVYPLPSEANAVIAGLASKRGIPLVNQLEAFKHTHSDPEAKKVFFLPDNHCSDIGNRLVAETMLKEVQAALERASERAQGEERDQRRGERDAQRHPRTGGGS